MKRLFKTIVSTLLVIMGTTGIAFADNATREECIAKSKEAAELLQKDLAGGIAEISKKDGQFVWKGTYVFVMDLDGKMLAHPTDPSLTKKPNLLSVTDKDPKNPKLVFVDFVKVAKEKGEGWVQYMWPKPGETSASMKETYIYRIPGTNYFTAAGIYN